MNETFANCAVPCILCEPLWLQHREALKPFPPLSNQSAKASKQSLFVVYDSDSPVFNSCASIVII